LGMPELSPMSLGPVEHHFPDVPIAVSIENFHQGSKMFPIDLDNNGEPTDEALEFRDEFYQDPVPHRHKYSAKDLPKGNKNIPEYSLMVDRNNNYIGFKYLDSRWFYSVWYEYLAKQTKSYQELVNLIED